MSTPEGPAGEPELPDEFAELFRAFGGAGALEQLRHAMSGSVGPVNWTLARQVALQLAAESDRPATPEETSRAEEAQRIAEHWLDEGTLPTPPDTGRLVVASRQAWVNAALDGMRELIEAVAAGSVNALEELIAGQVGQSGVLPDEIDLAAGLRPLLRPMGAVFMGVQAGQVIGTLSRQMIGQFDLGIPTADVAVAYRLPVNTADLTGYELDPTELEVVLALHEGAHRRQYHAVPWLGGHVRRLVAQFAEGTTIDEDRLADLSRDLMAGVDPEDPDSMREAMEQASTFRIEPTAAQERVLERIQGVVALLRAWARHEVRTAAEGRLFNLARIEEVARRRSASAGDGERMLAALLGLDLRPSDETLGEAFIETVREARGPEGLQRALAHPENLPDADELAEPSRWLVRMASGEDVPDDASSLFDGDPGPTEPSADERSRAHGGEPRDDEDDGDDPDGAADGR